MNKKVYLSMIILTISFLLGMYILKFFFPQEFLMTIENQQIISIGAFIDNHIWAKVLCIYATAFVTYWLYLCAVCKKSKLNIKEIIIVIVAISFSILFEFMCADILLIYNIIIMIGLPLLFKAEFKTTFVVFAVHSLSQFLSLNIRGIAIEQINSNYATLFLIGLECYFWLLLFYLYFNYKKKEI